MEKYKVTSKILVVDDEEDIELLIRQRFRKRITSGELEFFFARNGLQAMEILSQKEDIYMILTDLNMPVMDGISLIKKVSETHPLIRCVVITAYSDMDKIRKAMNSGAFDFLNKPLDLEDLEITLNRTLIYLEQVKEKAFLEKQLRQAQKMETLGQLASGIAHDFSNILMLTLGRSQILLYRELDEKTHQEILEIKKASEKAIALTNQLLTFSRKQDNKFEAMDLNITVRDIELMLRKLVGENIDIEFDLLSNLDPIKAEPGQIEQIIINLVINARDSMIKGGKIFIDTSYLTLTDFYSGTTKIPPGNYIVLSVRDEGEGMDEELMKNIFDPFFTTKKNNKSTGLGLSTVLNTTKNLDSYIVVNSKPDAGSTFKLFFPSIERGLVTSSNSYNYSDIVNGDETILIIEDEDGVRGLIREVLDMKGYKTLVAHHGTVAKKICEKYTGKIDMIIADVILPQINGIDVVESIMDRQPNTKILYISGYLDDPRVQEEVINAGLFFLPKPFSNYELVKKVREILDIK